MTHIFFEPPHQIESEWRKMIDNLVFISFASIYKKWNPKTENKIVTMLVKWSRSAILFWKIRFKLVYMLINLSLFLQEISSDHNRLQPISSPRYKNWACQVYGNSNNVNPMQVFSIAASSGFPSSTATTPPPSASLPPNLQDSNASAYNLGCLPFPATSNIY